MQKVYIAGSYSASNGIKFLDNIRRGRRVATEILLKGYAVFCPWLDSELFLQLRDGEEITSEMIQGHSIEWLRVSDILYVLKDWEDSKGTLAEIRLAKELDIPIYYEDGGESFMRYFI